MGERNDTPYIVIERERGGASGFLVGALLGAGAALLLAPRSGPETRRELREGARRARERAEGTVRQARDVVTDTVDDLRREVNDRLHAVSGAVEAGREAARTSREEMEQRLETHRGGEAAPGDIGPAGGEGEATESA